MAMIYHISRLYNISNKSRISNILLILWSQIHIHKHYYSYPNWRVYNICRISRISFISRISIVSRISHRIQDIRYFYHIKQLHKNNINYKRQKIKLDFILDCVFFCWWVFCIIKLIFSFIEDLHVYGQVFNIWYKSKI